MTQCCDHKSVIVIDYKAIIKNAENSFIIKSCYINL